MEKVIAALNVIQKDLAEQKIAIAKSAESVTEKVTENINKMLDTKFSTWEENQEKLKEKIENQEQRLNMTEKQARLRNIVFFGIEESERSYFDLEANLITFIENYFGLKLYCSDIQEARRIGKKTEKHRPVAVTFTTLGTKIKIMKQKGALKDTNYYIKEDYPRHVLEKRKILQEQIKIEKEKGNKAIIKYDKLVILKQKPETEQTDNRKRNLSISPQQNQNTVDVNPNSTHVAKKNKTLMTRNMPQRSSSLSEGTVKPGILNFLVNKKVANHEEDTNQTNNNNI
ncbi:hypothetical protein O3G_MSEX004020 [Manduca sexta]|uniref:Endonuclease-reverse transcriptase n=1 Tax=Manduca sexta TaxID=7130 RepID=A0A921YUK2_MANSE|nr:hypothetical protein O3G_MSEX004020 [Manduca sexta]